MKSTRRNLLIFISSAFVGASLGALTSGAFSTDYFALGSLLIITTFFSILAIWSTVDPPQIHEIMPLIVAYDKTDGKLTPITDRLCFVQFSYMKFRDALPSNPQPSQILKENDSIKSSQVVLDLAIYDLLDYLTQCYQFWWSPEQRYRSSSIGVTKRSYKTGVPSKKIQYSDLGNELKEKNIFFKLYGTSLFLYKDCSLFIPSETELSFSFRKIPQTHLSQPSLILRNKYCAVEININYSGWSIGLSSLTRYVELNDVHNRTDRAIYLQDHYANVQLELEFRASFNWFWALFPRSNDYFNWIEDLHDKLEDYFNFEREDEALRNSTEKIELGPTNASHKR